MARRKKKTEEPAADLMERPVSEQEEASAADQPAEEPSAEPSSVEESEPSVSAGFDPYNPPHLQKEPEADAASKENAKHRKSLNELRDEATAGDKDIADAVEWMEILHKDDVDKAGAPYWMHPTIVMMKARKLADKAGLDSKTMSIAALLHDVVEEGHTTIEKIRARFGAAVAEAVKVLTKDPKLTYMEYIAKIVASGDRTALAVKWADIMSNSDPRRLAKLSESDRNSLSKRYGNARKMVEKAWPLLKQMGERIDLKRKERGNA